MRIKSLKLTNWRNFLDKKIGFDSTIVLIGKNGQGKTNILESIYFLATTKSFRTTNNFQLINWENDFCRVGGEIEKEGGEVQKIELVINKNPQRKFQKKGKINNAPQKLIDILGCLKVVLFSPEMIDLISGSPATRRRYLDSVLAVCDHKYAENLFQLGRVLKRRNSLLSMIKDERAREDELDFWDKELINAGSYIILRRASLISFYNELIVDAYRDISNQPESFLRLKYLDSLLKTEEKIKREIVEKRFRESLGEKRRKEIEFGTTLVGPQRDELIFVLNERAINSFGSRGEFRSAVLAVKVVEIAYITQKNQGDKPVLLLDDVFSELDEKRRHRLAKTIRGVQSIITTTDLSHLDPELQKKAMIVKI